MLIFFRWGWMCLKFYETQPEGVLKGTSQHYRHIHFENSPRPHFSSDFKIVWDLSLEKIGLHRKNIKKIFFLLSCLADYANELVGPESPNFGWIMLLVKFWFLTLHCGVTNPRNSFQHIWRSFGAEILIFPKSAIFFL